MCGNSVHQSKKRCFSYFLFNMGNDTDKMDVINSLGIENWMTL